jgi:hypothetical protein
MKKKPKTGKHPHKAPSRAPKRKLGSYGNSIVIADDFDVTSQEVLDAFEGNTTEEQKHQSNATIRRSASSNGRADR